MLVSTELAMKINSTRLSRLLCLNLGRSKQKTKHSLHTIGLLAVLCFRNNGIEFPNFAPVYSRFRRN